MKMSATSASVASTAPALTHSARHVEGALSSAAGSAAGSNPTSAMS